MKKKVYFNWSTGKDSALALYYLQNDPSVEIGHLLTAVNTHFDRVSMHGLRRSLMETQIKEINIPFSTIELPESPSMEAYEQIMTEKVQELLNKGYTAAAFGDIFLEDLRQYREKQLEKFGINTYFPLWKKDTKQLLHEFLNLGFKAIVITVKSDLLDKSFVGRVIDADFIKELPKNVDPCGENGEFHTFCFDGPIFKNPIPFKIGETILKTYKNPSKDGEKEIGFWYCDLLPK